MVPDDPYYFTSGSWGQDYDDLWGIKKIQCEEAWEISEGEGVTVAAIDTGVDYNHEDIAQNIWINEDEIPGNGIDDDNNGQGNGYVDDVRGWDFVNNDNDPMDDHGHGTHVSGTIAAVGNNTMGVIGVAPKAKIMPLKGLNYNGSGKVSQLANAVKYAADNGANITSNSWGGYGTSQTLTNIFNYAHNKGCLSVAAAGNDDADVVSVIPASIENVVSVAASNQDDMKCSFSNYGLKIDVSAPGGDSVTGDGDNFWGRNILSLRSDNNGRPTDMYGDKRCIVGERYYRSRGTSMACPHAAGLVALIKAAYPEDTPDSIRGRLLSGVDNIDSQNSAFEGLLGSGRINAYKSLTAEERPILKVTSIESSGIDPGEDALITIELKNFWKDASGVTTYLTTENPLVRILRQEAAFGDILQGEVKTNANNPFIVSFDKEVNFGEVIDFNIRIVYDGISEENVKFRLPVMNFEDIGKDTNLPLASFLPTFIIMRDYNDDGLCDIFYNEGFEVNLYKNPAAGSFTKVTAEAGIKQGWLPGASLFLDIDNDADQDLFFSTHQSSENEPCNKLFLNKGDGTFTDITSQSGDLDRFPARMSAVAIDYDNDGFIDILGFGYEGGYKPRLLLLRNNTDNTFTNVIEGTGLPWNDNALLWKNYQITLLDYNNDGREDLLLSVPALYRNNGDGTFTDVTQDSGISASIKYGYAGSSAGDFNNDGFIDIFFTGGNFTDRSQGYVNTLYMNNGDGTFTDVTEASGNPGDETGGFLWGTDFMDFDNDGYLDLHISNIGKASLPGFLCNTLWRNNRDGTFTNVTKVSFPIEKRTLIPSAGIGDYDNDGDLDIYAPASNLLPGGQGAFLRNRAGAKRNWLKLKLEGRISNRDAYGARVYVKAGGAKQTREVHTSTVETQPLHFGLGDATLIDEIEIRWPSGIIQKVFNVNVNQTIEIIEEKPKIPIIYTVTPSSGKANDKVTIEGKNFGEFSGDMNYNPNCDFDKDGDVDVTDLFGVFMLSYGTLAGDMAYNPLCDFDVDGDVDVTDLFGVFMPSFGSLRGDTYVEFHDKNGAKIIEWSDTKIVCEVPLAAESGNIYVTTAKGTSNGVYFTVLRPAPNDLAPELYTPAYQDTAYEEDAPLQEETYSTNVTVEEGPEEPVPSNETDATST